MHINKYFSLKVFLLLLLLLSIQAIPINSYGTNLSSLPLNSVAVLNNSVIHLILILLGPLTIISAIIVFLLRKLKRLSRELEERNKQILDINIDLKKTKSELEIQNNLFTKEHYDSDKFYGMLVQAATDGISFYDRDWKLKYGNSAFYSMIGLDKDSYNSISPQDLIHPDNHDYQLKREQALISKGFFESELKLKHKEGHYVNFSTRSVTVRRDDGEIIGALTISHDITKLKKVHEDLIQANIDAETSNRLKSSFLANISHEIRTPLNSVVGFSNLLLTNDISDEIKEEYIENINYNSEKLLQIIGDIIDLSRLESSQIEITYEEASLSTIVNEIIEEAKQVVKRNEKSIILNVNNQFEDNSDLIFTDKIWLKRILNHLMDNAVKFTLDGSIEFSYFREENNIVFKIKDTGIGINKENLGSIFEEFRQEIDGHQRPFEGLGIGLTLAKEVVEKMGGKIFVQSEKGVGSEFSFSLPYRPAGSTKIKTKTLDIDQPVTSFNWSTKKCLIVDDNKEVLIYLNRILLDTGVTIITARSGLEAIELVKSTTDIDIVLLDLQMPEMNGIEATKKIRETRKDITIIAQTAFIFEDDKDIILEAGCDACLIKPIRKDHLLTTISSFVKSN